jgi:hypothetical protein
MSFLIGRVKFSVGKSCLVHAQIRADVFREKQPFLRIGELFPTSVSTQVFFVLTLKFISLDIKKRSRERAVIGYFSRQPFKKAANFFEWRVSWATKSQSFDTLFPVDLSNYR